MILKYQKNLKNQYFNIRKNIFPDIKITLKVNSCQFTFRDILISDFFQKKSILKYWKNILKNSILKYYK